MRPTGGPQRRFYAIANPINRILNVFAMGELILVRKDILDRLVPIPPCLAEDTYLMFKAKELGFRVDFCQDTYVSTKTTRNAEEEVLYKERTTLGILQALKYADPPKLVKVFYYLLPLLALVLMAVGKEGRAWSRGITNAIRLHLRGSNRSVF